MTEEELDQLWDNLGESLDAAWHIINYDKWSVLADAHEDYLKLRDYYMGDK